MEESPFLFLTSELPPPPLFKDEFHENIIPQAGHTIDMAQIRQHLDAAGLARQKFPEHLVLVDDLPRVPSGKVKKDVLRIRARAIAEGVEP